MFLINDKHWSAIAAVREIKFNRWDIASIILLALVHFGPTIVAGVRH